MRQAEPGHLWPVMLVRKILRDVQEHVEGRPLMQGRSAIMLADVSVNGGPDSHRGSRRRHVHLRRWPGNRGKELAGSAVDVRRCLGAAAAKGKFTLVIPEKGLLGTGSVRITLK